MLSPVALFVYNRPEHTKKTVEALLNNTLSSESCLYIFSDAPVSPKDAKSVMAVRDYVKRIRGFKEIIIYERDINYGLTKNILTGISTVFKKNDRIIVLEDDILTSPVFLKYMNTALEYYKNEDKVMNISAHMFNIDSIGLPSSFFLKFPGCWGWGTWKNAWQHYNNDCQNLMKTIAPRKKAFNCNNTYNFFEQMELNLVGKIKTWAVFWYASIFIRDGLSLRPAKSLVQNTGLDGSGTNCTTDHPLRSLDPTLINLNIKKESNIIENPEAKERVEKYFKSIQDRTLKRVYRRTKINLLKMLNKKQKI